MPSWANATTFARLSDTVLSLYKIFACSITAKYCAEKDIFSSSYFSVSSKPTVYKLKRVRLLKCKI